MLYLRDATDSDMSLVLSWRNNPLIWELTYTQREPISWANHKNWFQSRQDNRLFMITLVEDDFARDVGFLSISPLQYWSPEIGIIIGEVSLWGKNIGTEAFKLACQWLKDKGYKHTMTTVLNTNLRAIGMLKNNGFERTSDARKGESRYEKEL